MNNVLKAYLFFLILAIGYIPLLSQESAKRLFILSGQSNMQGHRPQEAFTPRIEEGFGKNEVAIVQYARGGKPIHRWWKEWKDLDGNKPEELGDLYDNLLSQVKKAIEESELQSVCFVWMQGERDARMGWGKLYKNALIGLHAQLAKDLNWDEDQLIMVIGRLSDFDMQNKKYPHWTMIREVQMEVAENNSQFFWIDTDDLNDGINRKGKKIKNDLHYSANGYRILGTRFAQACIEALSASKNL